MARQARRFTIYDAMEDKGVFEANPANVDSRDHEGASLYRGPVAYPKMLYHPEGEMRISVPGTVESTPWGPKEFGEQRELITRTVNSKAEEDAFIKQGWHTHPAKALVASGALSPPVSSDERVLDLEAQMEKMKAELAEAKAGLALAEDSKAKAGNSLPKKV